jgi:hypothetical protein
MAAAYEPALVELALLHDMALAAILRGRLAAAGIPALLFDAGFSGLLGGSTTGVRLMVEAADAEAARLLLDMPESLPGN